MGALLFITGVAVAVLSSWIFYRIGYYSLLLLIPLAAVPFLAVNYTGLLSLFIIPAAMGFAGGYAFKKGKDFGFYLTVSSILFAALFTADYHALRIFKGADLVEKARDEVVFIMEQSSGDMEKVFNEYKTPDENRKKIKADVAASISVLKDSKWLQFARDMIPFSAFFYGLAVCGISFIIMKKYVMKKAGEQVKTLENLKLNDYFIFALIAGWGGFILLDSTAYPAFSIAALNLALTVSTLYIIQALGIIKFFMTGRGIPALILPLIVLTIIFLGAPVIIFTTILLLGAGTLDLWADFRKLVPDKERNNKE